MRRALVFIGLVACGGGNAPPRIAAPAAARVVLELVRRPPVGTRWHEVRTYTRDQDAAMASAKFAHHYRDEIEADVTVIAREPTREVIELMVTRHESVVDGRPYPGVQAPGARVRLEHTTGRCKATDAAGAPLDHDGVERMFSHLFDCSLQNATDNDDDFFATREAHAPGETWSMSRPTIARMLGVSDLAIERATVSLEATKDGHAITATYAVPSAGASGTFRNVVPSDPNLPLLESQTDVIRETHERLRRSVVRTALNAPR